VTGVVFEILFENEYVNIAFGYKIFLENYNGYKKYPDVFNDLLFEGKSSGAIQSEDLTHYSSLNENRMHRLDRTIKISEEIVLKLQLKSVKKRKLNNFRKENTKTSFAIMITYTKRLFHHIYFC
jgi:hypothetical protein